MEKAREFHSPLYLCFIDLKKAYDSVNRDALWATLRKRYGIPSKLVHILGSLHEGTKGVVRAYGKVSDEFPIMNGVRQGDILAPTLFNLFFDAVIDMAVSKHPGHGAKMWFNTDAVLVGSRKKMKECVMIQDLEYADDMCLISDNMDELEMMLQDMNESCSEMGLTISTKKSKIMAVLFSLRADNPQQLPQPVQIQLLSDPVSVVSDFQYLGSIITSDCNMDTLESPRPHDVLDPSVEYQRRIKTTTKLRMFKAVVLPTLLYGSESWTRMSKHVKRLQGFVMRCLWIILGISLREKRRHTELRELGGVERMDNLLRYRRLRWLEHVARMGQWAVAYTERAFSV